MQKKYRLTNSRSFDVIYKKGKGISDNGITLITLESKYPNLKAGFVAGKKVGKSVRRNKVKRRMKEAFRQLLPRVLTGFSYVFIAKPAASNMDYHQIYSVIEGLLKASDKLK